MDFFSRLTNAGKNVASKASDLTEQARLNARLSQEEAKKNKALGEIGRIFYEANKYAMGDEYLPYSSEVELAEKEIASIKDKLRILKGVRTCKNCGARIGRHDIYCSVCGTKNDIDLLGNDMDPFDEQPDRICPVCKTAVPVNVKFCPTCGERLDVMGKQSVFNKEKDADIAAAEAAFAETDFKEPVDRQDTDPDFKEPADEPEDAGEFFAEPAKEPEQGTEDFSDFDDNWAGTADKLDEAAWRAGEAAGDALKRAGDMAEDAWYTVKDTAGDVFDRVSDYAEDTAEWIGSAASDFATKAGDTATDLLNRASDAFGDMWRNPGNRDYTEIRNDKKD
ncbi:MAG: zinc ribbon domain-containing protein [Lachnospiraceae bacterium]|nr:zinc ribbon domain-containing protein [Lachnospiraceae bacterium]